MIIADDFVFLHPPKTGGSFVTEVLTDVDLYSSAASSVTRSEMLRWTEPAR